MNAKEKIQRRMRSVLSEKSNEILDAIAVAYFVFNTPTIEKDGREILIEKISNFRYFCYIEKFKYPKLIKLARMNKNR
ncbi:MAG: hypothetical protein ABII64_00600 [Elusimicrobiota bacterium]